MFLFPLCAFVVALSVALKVFAGPMERKEFPWVAVWFAEDGKTMLGAPDIGFRTHDACVEYATDRAAMAEVIAGLHVTFKCRRGPYIEA